MDETQEASSSSASGVAMHEEPEESYVDEEEEEEEGSLDEGGDGRGKAPVILSKEQAQSNIDSELLKMQKARAVQAERKLQYLLKQSDIFQVDPIPCTSSHPHKHDILKQSHFWQIRHKLALALD